MSDDIPLDITGHETDTNRAQDEGEGDSEPLLSDIDAPGAAEADDEVEPIELLVQLAKDGEIEPWDIDIVRVTERFLDRLDDADLRAGGRALFYASVLLRMKSDAMLDEGPEPAEPEPEPWDDPPTDGHDPFAALEQEIDRRLDRKHARGTPQTLDELVRELRERERETVWKESRTYDTSESPGGYARGTQTLDYRSGDDMRIDEEPREADALGRTHDEHMEEIINDVYLACQHHYERGRDEVLYAEILEAGGSRVDTYLGLLFLAHRGQVHLDQDELFGDLWVRDPAAVSESAEALADGGRDTTD